MLKAGIFGTIAAGIAVAITFFIADAASGPLMATPPGGDLLEEIPLVGALVGTITGGIVGTIVAALLNRFMSNAVPLFVGFCVVGLIAYGAFSFSATEELSAGIWLNIMHIVAAIPIVGGLVQAMTPGKA